MKDSNKKNAYQKTLQSYRNTEILTANKEAILILLYEGAIRFLKQAIQATEKKDLPEKGRLIGRVQDIVNELRATLNHKEGGELATSLDTLYLFITDRLMIGNQDNDTQKLNEALGILATLHEAWQQAVSSLRNETKTAENR
ncbi:MAG: flagellar export chaperone FliS [Deltaproteobacteria bacterium]